MYKKYVYYMYLTVLFGFHSNAATFHLLVCTLFAVTVLKVLLLHALCPWSKATLPGAVAELEGNLQPFVLQDGVAPVLVFGPLPGRAQTCVQAPA